MAMHIRGTKTAGWLYQVSELDGEGTWAAAVGVVGADGVVVIVMVVEEDMMVSRNVNVNVNVNRIIYRSQVLLVVVRCLTDAEQSRTSLIYKFVLRLFFFRSKHSSNHCELKMYILWLTTR